jgi:hypothetical protein
MFGVCRSEGLASSTNFQIIRWQHLQAGIARFESIFDYLWGAFYSVHAREQGFWTWQKQGPVLSVEAGGFPGPRLLDAGDTLPSAQLPQAARAVPSQRFS